MIGVAAYAGSCFPISRCVQLSMNTCQIFLVLIYGQTRIELLHVDGIAVTLCAGLYDIRRMNGRAFVTACYSVMNSMTGNALRTICIVLPGSSMNTCFE